MIGLSHTATVTTIITDLGCAMLPGMLLWKTQMKSQAKLEVFALMSVASIEQLDYIGYIVLFSNIETGVGCVASCLPSIRRLQMRITKRETSENKSTNPEANGSELITIGGGGGGSSSRGRKQRGIFTNTTDRGVTLATVQVTSLSGAGGGGEWEQLHDDDSDEAPLSPWKESTGSKPPGGIRKECTYAVEMEPVKGNDAGLDRQRACRIIQKCSEFFS
ncbi:hypothetical protein Daus18300_009192 [Diaporthe australafricana]|uniref:Integral membrane protein n=1 Tax=Diaporthe australafricana TaxID=127596 RepID=A0ABR3WF94_9PEZI